MHFRGMARDVLLNYSGGHGAVQFNSLYRAQGRTLAINAKVLAIENSIT